MDLSSARMAEMLAPLAQAHNDQQRRELARRPKLRPTVLTGWDLLKIWSVAAHCNSAEEIQAKAGVGIHTRTNGVRVLAQAGWLARAPGGREHCYEPTVPEQALQACGNNKTSLILWDLGARAAAAGVQMGRSSTDPEGMNPPHINVSVTIHIEVLSEADAARLRATSTPPGAQARRDEGQPGAPARHVAEHVARQRATSDPHGAQARRVATDHALDKGSQSVLSSTPSPKTDRSIDRNARGGGEELTGWTCPAESDPLPDLLRRETGMPFSDVSTPDLVTLFRNYAPGSVFATFLSLCEEAGGCNQGGLNQGVRSERSASWSHAATRDALARLGVQDHAAASRLAWMLCPATVAALAQIREECDRKAARGTGRKIDHVTPWAETVIRSGTPYARAWESAVQRFKGRQAERDAIAKRQEQEAAAKSRAKAARDAGRTPDAAAKAEEIRRTIADAKVKDLVDALAEVKKAGGMFTTLIAKRATELRSKHPDETNGEIVRRIAQSPSLIGAVADALAKLAKESRRG